MATIREELERAAVLVGGKAWGVEKLKPRIYMPSRRDTKVYFEFPDACYTSPDDEADAVKCLGGAALKVFIDDCGQHPNWYKSQAAKIRRSQLQPSLALAALEAGDEALADAIMDDDDGLIDDAVEDGRYDEAANHLANCRLHEARTVLNLAE